MRLTRDTWVLVLVLLGCGPEPSPQPSDHERAQAVAPAPESSEVRAPPVEVKEPPAPAPPPPTAPGPEVWLELFDDPSLTSVKRDDDVYGVGIYGAYRCSGSTNPYDDPSPPGERAHPDGPLTDFELIVGAQLRRGRSTQAIRVSVHRIREPSADPMAHFEQAHADGFRCLCPHRYAEVNSGRLSAIVRWRDAWISFSFEGGGRGMRGFSTHVERIIGELAAIDDEAFDAHYLQGFDCKYNPRSTAELVDAD